MASETPDVVEKGGWLITPVSEEMKKALGLAQKSFLKRLHVPCGNPGCCVLHLEATSCFELTPSD